MLTRSGKNRQILSAQPSLCSEYKNVPTRDFWQGGAAAAAPLDYYSRYTMQEVEGWQPGKGGCC